MELPHLPCDPIASGAKNTVTVKLRLAGVLNSDCSPSIRIEGLNGESCGSGTGPQASTFTVASDPDFVFFPTGSFLGAGPVELITLNATAHVAAGENIVEFHVTNPCKKQGGSLVSAWVVYSKQAAPGYPVSTVQSLNDFKLQKIALGVCAESTSQFVLSSDAKPIKTHAPALTTLELTSSSTQAEEPNDISIIFKANFDFKTGMGFRIEGLLDVTGPATVKQGSVTAQLDSTKGILTVIAASTVTAATTDTTFVVTVTNKRYGTGSVPILVSVTGYTCGCVGTSVGDAVSTIGPFQPKSGFVFMSNTQPGGGTGGADECAVDCSDFVPKFQVTVEIDISCSVVGDNVDSYFRELVGCVAPATPPATPGDVSTLSRGECLHVVTGNLHTWKLKDSLLSSDQIRSILHRLRTTNTVVDGVPQKNGDLGKGLEAKTSECQIYVDVSKTDEGASDDAFCTALDDYHRFSPGRTKACFVQVKQYAINICTSASDATKLAAMASSVGSCQMLILESVAEHTGVKIDDLSMSFGVDGKKIIVEVNMAGNYAIDVNKLRRGAHAGLLRISATCLGGNAVSSCTGWKNLPDELTVLDMGKVVQVGTTLRTSIDLSSLAMDISCLQNNYIFIDAAASSLGVLYFGISSNDLFLSSRNGGYTLNIDIAQGASTVGQPVAQAIKDALAAGLNAVVGAAKAKAMANGGVTSESGIKEALSECGLVTLNPQALAAAKANGGIGTDLGLKAALLTSGLVLVVETPNLDQITVPAPVIVTVGSATAGGACGNATKTEPAPAPKQVPVDTSSWPCSTLSCAADSGLDCSAVAASGQVLAGAAGRLGVAKELIRITRMVACNISICTKNPYSDSQLKTALQDGLNSAGLVSENISCSSQTSAAPVDLAPGNPSLVSCSAHQSSAFPCDSNYLTICFQTNVSFKPYNITEDVSSVKGPVIVQSTYYRTIRIAGLKGSKCGASGSSTSPACCHGPNTGRLNVNGVDAAANLFNKGAWSNTAGTLDVRIEDAVDKDSRVCLTIQLENPKCAQQGVDAVTLSIVSLKEDGTIETSSGWSTAKKEDALKEGGATWSAQFSRITCSTAGDLAASGSCPASPTFYSQPGLLAGGAKPLLVIEPQIVHKSISQSSGFPCEKNTISVKLSFNVPLLCACTEANATTSGQKVTLSGLTGSLTDDLSDAAASLTDKTGTNLLNRPLSWKKNSGTLVLDLGPTSKDSAAQYAACNLFQLKFNLLNPNTAKPAATVSVDVPALVQEGCSCIGGCCNPTCSSPIIIANPSIDDAPLYIKQGSIKATMCQSTAWPGAPNKISVTLTPNINLYAKASAMPVECQSRLTISGLDMACRRALDGTGTSCYEDGTIQLLGRDKTTFVDPVTSGAAASSGYFSYTCREAQSIQSATLTLSVFEGVEKLEANDEYIIEFEVHNPMQGQNSPPIFVSGTNPLLSAVSVQPCTLIPPNEVCADAACAFGAGDGAPLKVYSPQFLKHEMGQSNPYPCMQNVLTVTLQANTRLNVNAVITLTNLHGINVESQDIALLSGNDLFKAWNVDDSKQGKLAWDAESNKTTLTVSRDISVAESFVFSFQVKNPCCAQMSPVVCVKASRITGGCASCESGSSGATCGSTECGKCVSIARQMMERDFFRLFDTGIIENNKYTYSKKYAPGATVTYGSVELGDAYPLKIFQGQFIAIDKSIGQSTPYPSLQNTITVTFATTIPLLASTKVSLSGFRYCNTAGSACTYMATADNLRLPITTSGWASPHDEDFAAQLGTTAEWDREDGTLVLTLAASTVAGTQYVFSLVLTNPTTCQQLPRDITITAGCCPTCKFTQILKADKTTPTAVCGGQATYAEPLRIISPMFVQKNIWQSTPYPCRNNTISVQIQSNVNVKANTKITIKGLKNTETRTQSIAIHACNDVLQGSWTQSTGELVFALVTELNSCQMCDISFTVQNPCCCQGSPADGFSIAADLNCDSISLHSANRLTVMTNTSYLHPDVVQPTPDEVAPLRIRCPRWVAKSIVQDSSYPCADNKLSVTLAFNVPIIARDGTTVTLTGIHDSLTPLSSIPIDEPVAIMDELGEFMPAKLVAEMKTVGELKVNITGDVPAYQNIAFSFTVINPSTPTCLTPNQQTSSSPACSTCIESQNVYVRANTKVVSGIELTIPGDQVPGSTFVYPSNSNRCESLNPEKNCRLCMQTSYQLMDQPSGKIMMVQVAKFKVRNIAQSTPWPCALNTLTVSLSTNVPFVSSPEHKVHCTPLITISGLNDACVISTSVALSEMNDPPTFGGRGEYSGGALIMTPVNDAPADNWPADAVRAFTFQINNPVNSQPAPLIQIESSGIPVCKSHMIKDCDYDHDNSGALNMIGLTAAEIDQRNTDYNPLALSCDQIATSMSGDGATQVRTCARLPDSDEVGSTNGAVFDAHPRDAEPLRVHAPAFITRDIGQNSSYPGALNRITVTIRTNVDLPVDSLVTISVLNNACVTSGAIQLHSSQTDDPLVFAASKGGAGGKGMWDDVEKMLKLHVVVHVTAGSYYTFGFDVQNPLCSQEAQPVCIRAKGFCTGESCRSKVLVIPRRLMEHDHETYATSCDTQGIPLRRAPLSVVKPTIIMARLKHSSAWASANNTLELSLKLNVPLFIKASPKLTINLGEHGSSTPAGALKVIFGGMDTTAHWDPAAKTLQMDVPMDLDACTQYDLGFTLVNRNCQNQAPTTSVAITMRSDCSIARNMSCFDTKIIEPVKFDHPSGCSTSSSPLEVHAGPCTSSSAGATATFTVKKVTQSSCRPGCNNTIDITIKSNVPIPAYSTQKIVVNFQLPADVCIVKYNTLPEFAPAWVGGNLELTVKGDLDACKEYIISFTVTNDVNKQLFLPTRKTQISATGPIQITSVDMVMDSDACKKPFEVKEPAFEKFEIGQSTPYPGAVANRLCVTISTNTHMKAGSAFALHGLHGAIAPDGDLALTGASASVFVSADGTASHGTWNNCEKVLDLHVISDLGFCGEGSELRFCFNVANPIDAQLCAPVRINATKVATCKGEHKNILVSKDNVTDSAKSLGKTEMGVTMKGDESTVLQNTLGAYLGDACPMVVWAAAFCEKDIGQSSDLPCDINTITITLSSNVPLYATVDYSIAAMAVIKTEITITGLKGAILDQDRSKTTGLLNLLQASDGEDVAQFKDSRGTWRKNADDTYDIVLKLEIDCCLPAAGGEQGVVFQFYVTNPPVLTERSVPTVQALGINVIQTSMREGVGSKRPMSIAKTTLTEAIISQSTAMPCQTNEITVSLKGTSILTACGARLTISGLLSAVHANGPITIIDGSASIGDATWENGIMRVNVADKDVFPSNTPVSFMFKIKNPSAETAATAVKIGIDAADWPNPIWARATPTKELLPSQNMAMPAQSALRPITVVKAQFIATDKLVGNIFQSSPYPGKVNTITVSLRASVPLKTRCDVMVTIGPLDGACIEDNLVSFQIQGGVDVFAGVTDRMSSWNAKTRLLTLKTKAQADDYTDDGDNLLYFSMDVKNPVTAQQASMVSAVASGVVMPTMTMHRNLEGVRPLGLTSGEPIDAEPMYIRGLLKPNQFDVRDIGQDTAEPGMPNVITITIATNIPLTASNPATTVTLSGLDGAKSYGGIADGSSRKFTATWLQDKASLVLQTVEDTDAGEEITLFFKFDNPDIAQVSPRVYIEASGIAIAPMPMNPDMTRRISTTDDDGQIIKANPGFAAPLAVMKGKFYSRNAHQTSTDASSQNILTFSFKSSVALRSSTSHVALVVSGLNGMRLMDGLRTGTPTVVVTQGGEASLITDSSCVPTAAGDALAPCAQCARAMRCPYLDGSTPNAPKLMVGIVDIPAHTEIEFQVTFMNANEAQDCQKLTLETMSCDVNLDFAPLPLHFTKEFDPEGPNQCPLTIIPSSPFIFKKVCQSVPCSGAVNTITVSLQPKFALTGAKGSEVTIRGLRGSTMRDSMVTLLSGAHIFESKARWIQSSGSLILKVAPRSTLDPSAPTLVSFDIVNPRYKQAAAELVEILASGDVAHEAVSMDQCDGDLAPMLIKEATFQQAAIASSSTEGGGDNVVTITLQPRCTVLCESRASVITVAGLVGSSTGDSKALPVSMIKGSPGLFMSLAELSLSFTKECALKDNKLVISGVHADPTGAMLYFSHVACADRYTTITKFDHDTGCATLASSSGKWSDELEACSLGAVGSITVTQGGSGFESGDFIVDSETGLGLTGQCVVTGKDGSVASVVVSTPGKGYNQHVKVRCPRSCPIEQKQQVATCACGCINTADTAATNTGCSEPVKEYGMYSSASIASTAKITSVCAWSQTTGRLTCAVQGCVKSSEETVFSVALTNARINQPAKTVNVMASGHIGIPAEKLNGQAMQIKTQGAPGRTKVQMTMLTSRSSWDKSTLPKEGEYLKAVAAAAGVDISKVTAIVTKVDRVTVLTLSGSYQRAIEKSGSAFQLAVTVEVEGWLSPAFIAHGMSSERINSKLKAVGLSVEVPEEHKAQVVYTAPESVTAVCKCAINDEPPSMEAIKDNTAYKCKCSVSIDIPTTLNTNTYILSSDMQCNAKTYVTGIKVGTSDVSLSAIKQAPDTCADKCGEYHKMLQHYDVTSDVDMDAKKLEVEIEVEGLSQDYCGAGDYFKAVLLLSYDGGPGGQGLEL
jgi:hypothetical protein